MMRGTSHKSLPGLQRPQYDTRSRYRENARNDFHGITTCAQEVNLEEIQLHSVKTKDLGSCLVANSTNMVTSTFFNYDTFREWVRDAGKSSTRDVFNIFNANIQPVGEQNSNDLQNIQKSASFMCKNRDVNLQNIRKSPRLSVQNRRDKHVFESNQEEVNHRSNSQIESLDKNKLCFPAEVVLAESQQSQDRSVEYEGEKNMQNVRKSPRLSEEARERDMQLLFGSTEKITNCRKKSRIKDLNQERLFSPAKVNFVNMAQVHNESSNDDRGRDVQNTRTLPRVSGKIRVVGQQSIADSSIKGVCRHESHIKSTCKSNFSFKTKAAPASMPQMLNTCVSYDETMNSSKFIRKSVRLSCKNGEVDLQKTNLPAKFSFATDVELTTITQVQNKSSDCQGTDLKTAQRSLRLSCKSRETNLDSAIECSEAGRSVPHENGSDLNTLSAVKLFDKPQIQNISASPNGHVGLKNMQKSPHLSGMKRQQDLQICSRKEVKLGAEYQKKGCHGNKLSLPIKAKFTNAPSAQNQTLKSKKEEINLGLKSQKKGFDGSTTFPPIEVELTSVPSLHNETVKADGCLLNKAIGSPLNSFESLPSFQYYVSSGKGINLIVDLNSSPSDWTKKIFETSSSSQSLQKNKFESFRHEIESLRSKKMISSLVSRISPSHLQNDACLKSISGETSPLRTYIPESGNGSSDITETNSCIDARTGDGHLENCSDINTGTSAENIFPSQECLETRITISEPEASEQSSKRPVNMASDGSHKRKYQCRKICGIRLKSGKRLGSRKSMRLWYQGGPR